MTRATISKALGGVAAGLLLTISPGLVGPAHAQEAKQPNIVVIMGDDIGWSNIGVYNQGIMAGRTPHLDQLATEGMRFTDYYAEASCTAMPRPAAPRGGPTSSPASCRSAPA
jgi:hypothetical protein